MESILDIQWYIYMGLYVIVTVLALVRFPEYKSSALKFFPLLLLFTLLIEFGGSIIATFVDSNVLLYNCFNLIYFIFIFIVFREATDIIKFKLYINCLLVIFIGIFLYFALTTNFVDVNQVTTYVSGEVFGIICILLYYISILRSDAIIDIKYDRLFWISIGFLLFFSGTIPIEIMRNKFERESNLYDSLIAILNTLIIIMNLCFIVGLLVKKPKRLSI